MRSLLLLVLLLACSSVGLVGAEEGGGFSDLNKAAKDKKEKPAGEAKDKAKAGKDAAKADAPSPVAPAGGTPEADQALGNRGKLASALRDYCQQRNLPIAETAGKSVRLFLIGTVNADAKDLVEHADLALTGLETWTGQSGTFAHPGMTPDEIYTLAIFPDQGARDGFIDRSGGDNALAKKCGSIAYPRGSITDVRILPIARWWSVFAASGAAIDAFYAERGQKTQVWLKEGLGCELQRLICDKQVRMYSIAYQENSAVKLDGDWAKDVAKMIQDRNQMITTASTVMVMDVIGIPGEHYKQMWSLATWVRGMAKSQRGGDNKLLRLFAETARGTSPSTAVKTVYGLEDPPLSKAWLGWASQAGK